MKKLKKIRLINWHYFANETIEVKNNILLTGQNATGKSTILDAISFVITAGEQQFNLAANEKGKRDLKGYVKCKLGSQDKEYLREGDVTGHIALEFYDESSQKSFTVGTVIDAFGELLPAKVIYYSYEDVISDSYFINDSGMILGSVDFRKQNGFLQYYLTKKEAKSSYRNLFGSINEDFFRLIHKALAFKPISDVKDFIYQHLLEEKQIDVENVKDSIRSYKELELTLNKIKAKIADLKEMNVLYEDIKNSYLKVDYYNYLTKVATLKNGNLEFDKLKKELEKLEEKKNISSEELRYLNIDIETCDEQIKDLYFMLSNNSDFQQTEFIDKKILNQRALLEELSIRQEDHIKNISYTKDLLIELKKINKDFKIYNDLHNMNLNRIPTEKLSDYKLNLSDIDTRIKERSQEIYQELGQLENEKQALLREINEISQTLRGLEGKNLRYNPQLIGLKQDIENGLKNLYGYSVSVHILAELLEITDPVWHDTIENYLGGQRFNLIVEPRYFDAALQVYNRVKNNHRIYGIGLVNTKKIDQFNTCKPNSIASIITSESIDAKRYINMVCGNVIMCNSAVELEEYSNSITNDGLIYSHYTVRTLNINTEKPFIGKNATDSQKQIWGSLAEEKRTAYLEINNLIDLKKQELSAISKLDFTLIYKNMDASSKHIIAENTLEDLIFQKKQQKELTNDDIKVSYESAKEELKKLEASRAKKYEEIGKFSGQIEMKQLEINDHDRLMKNLEKEVDDLTLDNPRFVSEANEEFNSRLTDFRSIEQIKLDYVKKADLELQTVKHLSDTLIAKQAKYINNYLSTYQVGYNEFKPYLDELVKLERSELVTYENKVRKAREDAEICFREDFLSKLRNYIMSAENELCKINETLKMISFGSDSYQFIFPKSKEYSAFYEMVTSDLSSSDSTGLLALDFDLKYNEQLESLFTHLAQDELNSNGAISKFTDYRTYMDYDIKIINSSGDEIMYSRVFKEKSGGETQVPFYVAIIASFVRLYQRSSKNSLNDAIGLVLFDEVFDKMDSTRMKAMMSFIASMPIQIILACPPQRMEILSKYTDTTLITLREGRNAKIYVKTSID